MGENFGNHQPVLDGFFHRLTIHYFRDEISDLPVNGSAMFFNVFEPKNHGKLWQLGNLVVTAGRSQRILQQQENNQLVDSPIISHLVGGFNPSEKYVSQLGLLCPIYGRS